MTIEDKILAEQNRGEVEAELATLKQLVREMVELLSYAGKTLTLVGAMHHRPPDEHIDQMKEILNRPEVKAILGEE